LRHDIYAVPAQEELAKLFPFTNISPSTAFRTTMVQKHAATLSTLPMERKKEITAVKIIFILTEKENGSSFRTLIQSTSSGETLLIGRVRFVQSSQRNVYKLIDDGSMIQLEHVWMYVSCCRRFAVVIAMDGRCIT
jgi:hypothetical protein